MWTTFEESEGNEVLESFKQFKESSELSLPSRFFIDCLKSHQFSLVEKLLDLNQSFGYYLKTKWLSIKPLALL
jgi:hypothetical protein